MDNIGNFNSINVSLNDLSALLTDILRIKIEIIAANRMAVPTALNILSLYIAA